jgi:hypothetical protein
VTSVVITLDCPVGGSMLFLLANFLWFRLSGTVLLGAASGRPFVGLGLLANSSDRLVLDGRLRAGLFANSSDWLVLDSRLGFFADDGGDPLFFLFLL